MNRGAWWATVHRVAKSWTQLKRLTMQAILKPRSSPVGASITPRPSVLLSALFYLNTLPYFNKGVKN